MKKLYVLLLFLTLISCNNDEDSRHSGICLSFDDRAIEEWFELRDLFNENNVKVTFFITQPDSISISELKKLRILEKDGHEIGFHGNLHVLSEYYIKEYSYRDYLEKEINDGLKKMDSLGFQCTAFAYPYGAKFWFTDFLLLQKFDFIRGVTPVNKVKDLTKMDAIYYQFDNTKTLSAVSLDGNAGIDQQMIEEALERASKKKEVLMLYAHQPVNGQEASGYTVSVTLLSTIIKKAKEMNIQFYTMKSLKVP